MSQGAHSPVYVDVEKGQVAVCLYLHSELYIPVKAFQIVKKPLQLLCSICPDEESVTSIMEPASPGLSYLVPSSQHLL
jgi:hypothetical protein